MFRVISFFAYFSVFFLFLFLCTKLSLSQISREAHLDLCFIAIRDVLKAFILYLFIKAIFSMGVVHFVNVCFFAKPLNRSEAWDDIFMTLTVLLLVFFIKLVYRLYDKKDTLSLAPAERLANKANGYKRECLRTLT